MTSKEPLLLKVADAALRRPDDTVRQVVYPVLGEDNLRNLAAEFKFREVLPQPGPRTATVRKL